MKYSEPVSFAAEEQARPAGVKSRDAYEAEILELREEIQRLKLKCYQAGRCPPSRFWRFVRRYAHEFAANFAYRVIRKTHRSTVGDLEQYPARPVRYPRFPRCMLQDNQLPSVSIVIPSFSQGPFLADAIVSVIEQGYPRLQLAVQDKCSPDNTAEILKQFAPRLAACVVELDGGQADAIRRGFQHIEGEIMSWLNSDDLLVPGALRYICEYFASHPEVDVIYGDRIVVDREGREVGRWNLPRHECETLRWVDYVPQETLFWRREIWDEVGGLDPSFRFAMDWDLLLRFQRAGANIARLPFPLGCFRVHEHQKTWSLLKTAGEEEMRRLRSREHERGVWMDEVYLQQRHIFLQSAIEGWRAFFRMRKPG